MGLDTLFLIKVKDNYSILQSSGGFASQYISTPISLIYQRGKVDEKKFPTLLSGNNHYHFATDPYNVIDGMTVGIDKDARGNIISNDKGKYYSYVPISKWEENNKYHDVAFVYEKENNRVRSNRKYRRLSYRSSVGNDGQQRI